MENLRMEIHKKSLEIKKKIKELNNILSHLYNQERESGNKNIYSIKRSTDKVSSASKHINNLSSSESKKLSGNLFSDEDINKVHRQTLNNIYKLQTFYKEKLSKEMLKEGSQEVNQLKRNIDSLRLASEDLKKLDMSFLSKDKDSKVWRFKEEERINNKESVEDE